MWADFVVMELTVDQGMDMNTAFGREIRLEEPVQLDFRAILALGGREPRWVE